MEASHVIARMEEIKKELLIHSCLRNPYDWLTTGTLTKDEQDIKNPYKPFPKRRYFAPMLDVIGREDIIFILKSRTMMASWLVAGWCAHFGFNNRAVRTVFQSRDLERALNMLDYVKVLWENSYAPLKSIWACKKSPFDQKIESFELKNGSSYHAIVGEPDKLRSLHPTVYVADEACYMDYFQENYAVAVASKCPKIIALSSVKPSSFWTLASERLVWQDWPEYMDEEEAA